MKRFQRALSLLVVLQLPAMVSAAGTRLKITIKGGDLAHRIEISDPVVMRKFSIGGGPGSWCEPLSKPACAAAMGRSYLKSFIVDWSQGVVNPPGSGLIDYDVEFLMLRPDAKNTYRVTYAYDPMKQTGFVHIPGADDPRYDENISLIKRGVEGNWYHAWSDWDAVVTTLLGAAR